MWKLINRGAPPPSAIRYSMVSIFCWCHWQQLTDALIEMLMVLIHNLGARVDKKQFAAFKKVRGETRLLFHMAETTVDQPNDVIKDVVYPVGVQKPCKTWSMNSSGRSYGTLSTLIHAFFLWLSLPTNADVGVGSSGV